MNNFEYIREHQLKDEQGKVYVARNKADGRIMIIRHAERGGIPNYVDRCTEIDNNGEGHLIPLNIDSANAILDRIVADKPWASCFVFSSVPDDKVFVVRPSIPRQPCFFHPIWIRCGIVYNFRKSDCQQVFPVHAII